MRLFPETPPPGPFRNSFWRSSLRGPRLTALLGLGLLVILLIVIVTGFLSHEAYEPDLGRNAIVPDAPTLLPFDWPTSPSWIYALNQGLHVTVGIIGVPLLLAKLWSVLPRLFAWPPVSSPAQGLERLVLLALVGGGLFQFATGVVNVQLHYPFSFNFVVAHYWGAWVFTAALFAHLAVKLPMARKALKTREEVLDHVLVAQDPDPPTLSRRGLLGLVGVSMGALAVTWAGQSIGGPARRLAVFAPRGGGSSFPVNKTAASARITPAMVGPAWRLEVVTRGPDGREERRSYTRAQLLALPQRTAELPISCVEGWSTTQTWTGVPLKALVGGGRDVTAVSLQPRGVLRQATYAASQVDDDDALLALEVNGEDLPLDHGFPARVIIPGLPGVHCTKWVARLEVA